MGRLRLRWGGCGHGITILMVEAVGIAEEDELRDSEVVGKARETGGIRMIIGEILCLFLLKKLPILIAPFPSTPCMVESPINPGSRRSVTPRMGFSVTTIGRI